MKISELMDMIRNQDLLLPEFQREYVWNREQAKQLIVSLLKGYPVGALLFWKTDSPPILKNVDKLPERLGTVQVILDGQQRLTTLYLLTTGEIPPYYREEDIQNDPRNLYYNLATGELQYYQASKMRDNPLWQRVVDCFTRRNEIEALIFELAEQQAKPSQRPVDLARRYHQNLTALLDILKVDLPVQTVPPHATLEEAVDIFDRVNSMGTKLSAPELALTHVTAKWPEARRVMKAKIDELKQRHFHFDLSFLTRALTVVVTRHALLNTIHSRPEKELKQGWERLSHILDYLVTILPQHAHIHSTQDLNSLYVLIPWIAYLDLHGGHFPSQTSMKYAIRWLYAAHIWSRYTAQTDQKLEQDVSIVVREEEPWERLEAQIIDQRGRIQVKASDFEGRWSPHPLFRMVYILAKAHGAIDWFNGVPLGSTVKGRYAFHWHHIFPTSILYRTRYDSDNHLHRKIVNEIANLAFLTATSNVALGTKLPEEYFPEVEERYPGALSRQFIPMQPELWKLERFEDFLEARRQLMARKINEYMDALVQEPLSSKERPIQELIALGESTTVEFKSTLQWDVVQNQPNKALRHSVLKTIAAFLNSEGGTLLIGVEDDGGIYGLDQDLKLVGNSIDRFQQLLADLISRHLGAAIMPLIKIRFERIEGKPICIVEVEKSPRPVFLDGPKGKEFYVRALTTTRALDPEQTVQYIQTHWG